MARKDELRRLHAGVILNLTSKKQETSVGKALEVALERLKDTFPVAFDHKKTWVLTEIVEKLRAEFPDVPFATPKAKSSMKPDGGVVSIIDSDGDEHPVLIVEVKNQGTNDLLLEAGEPTQAMGNAIERLGKNVIGFRTAMLPEGIMPFLCFGYGYDFKEGSSIRDRVITVAMFGPLNEINVVPSGEAGKFMRGSYFFREEEWSVNEMADVMIEVASRSIHFYFAKYGEETFRVE
jgi:type II restriction enzyme